MKIWALERKKQKIIQDLIFECEFPSAWSTASLSDLLTDPCQKLDISRPVVLEKHAEEMQRIGRVVFRSVDFMDSVSFDSFEIEVIDEGKKKKKSTGGLE